MATKNNKRTKITKLLLKNSLIELMHNKSINKITIKDICNNADLNRSTFYLHYTDQFALLMDIENEIIDNTVEYLKDIGFSSINSLTYVEKFLDYVEKNRDIFDTLLCQQDNNTFKNLFIEKVMEHLKDKISFKCSAEKKKYIYTFLWQGCIHIIIEWINADFDLSSKMIAEMIYDLCNNSLKTFSC